MIRVCYFLKYLQILTSRKDLSVFIMRIDSLKCEPPCSMRQNSTPLTELNQILINDHWLSTNALFRESSFYADAVPNKPETEFKCFPPD